MTYPRQKPPIDYSTLSDASLLTLANQWFDEMVRRYGKARKNSTAWENKKPGIVDWLKGRRQNKQDFSLRQATEANWTLKDYMDAWSWNERDAKLTAACLTGLRAFLEIRMMLNPPEGFDR